MLLASIRPECCRPNRRSIIILPPCRAPIARPANADTCCSPRSSNKPTTLFRSVTLLSGRRCGRIVATKSITEIDEAGLIGLMIGHTLEAAYPTSAVRGVIRCWSWIVLIDVAHERAKMQRKPTIPGDGHVFA